MILEFIFTVYDLKKVPVVSDGVLCSLGLRFLFVKRRLNHGSEVVTQMDFQSQQSRLTLVSIDANL